VNTIQSISLSASPPNFLISTNDKTAVAEYVRRWGGSASITLFDPSCNIFNAPGIDGIIGFRVESNCAVVFGDPVCDPINTPHLTQAFHQYCQEKHLRVAYITVSERFAKWAIKNICGSLIEIGEELYVDPHNNPKSGTKGRALRNKVNNAQRAGLLVNEYLGNNPELEKEIEQVGISWLKSRRGPQIYLAQVQLFAERTGKRWFYARYQEHLVGVLLLNRIEARQGWLLQLMMTTPEAPVGTSELLVMSALHTLQREDCHFFTFGVAQCGELGEIIGLSRFSDWLARIVFKGAKRIFHLDKRRRYLKKFQPQKEASYVLFSEAKIGFRDVSNIMRGLNVDV
jgi:lysylphosphatidylglycerol synthetase-like protein (DUF2156 family)